MPFNFKDNPASRWLFALLLTFVLAPVWAQQTPPANLPANGPTSTDAISGPIRKNDTIRVVVAGADNLGGEVRVDADGTISLPRLGQITVVGLMQGAAATTIAQRIQDKQLLKKADVAVYILARRARIISINGAVTTQGQQAIKDNAVLSEVLENAAPLANADLTRVVITRDGKDLNVNYKRYRNGEGTGAGFNPSLEDNDRIYVYSGTPTEGVVRVTGEVKDSTKVLIPISTGMTVGQVLQMVGGVTDYADRSGITITRGAQRIPVAYDDILRHTPNRDVPLLDKDEVNVPRLDKPKLVTVAGAVREPKNVPLLSRVTLLEAVAQSGGPQDGARQNEVELRRRDSKGAITTRTYSLDKDTDASTELIDGDYVFVPYGRQRSRADVATVVGVLSGLAILFSQVKHH